MGLAPHQRRAAQRLRYRVGPIASASQSGELVVAEIQQFYRERVRRRLNDDAETHSYHLSLLSRDGRKLRVVSNAEPNLLAELEWELEQWLGIRDVAVMGEG